MTSLTDFYSDHINRLDGEISAAKRRARLLLTLEIALFVAAVGIAIVYFSMTLHPAVPALAAALFCGYLWARMHDVRNDKRIEALNKRRAVYDKELNYLRGDFSALNPGDEYVDAKHEFSYDFDIFGRNSLFQRMDRTITSGGSDALARALQTLPRDANMVQRRRAAVDELFRMEEWRTEFLVRGTNVGTSKSAAWQNEATAGVSVSAAAQKINTREIIDTIRAASEMRLPRFFSGRGALVVAALMLTCFYSAIVASVFTPFPGTMALNIGMLQLFVALLVTVKPLNRMMKIVGKLTKQLKSCSSLVNHIASAQFESDALKAVQSELTGGDNNAMRAFAELSATLGSLDRRGNVLGLVVFNILFLSDFFLIRRFIRWQNTNMPQLEKWIAALADVDALVSMGVFRFNHPEAVAADVTDCDGVLYEAEGLYHPFLGRQAVRNDFEVRNGEYYIITGANMAGKSTFLRSVGINYVLAMNGLPVFAERLRVSLFNLFSSMRTTDDLSSGISYFNAELLRLGQLLNRCKNERHTLIILDEILKGTNSLDKLNGSRLFLEHAAQLPISGIIATHDLELSKMEDEHPDKFHNFCFEINLAANIEYTYKISRGVARNQNATFLLRQMLEKA